MNLIDSRLQEFSKDQQQIQINLREELQQQNQALIADISRLLEGFASQVGRVVKNELHTALEGVSLGASAFSSSSHPLIHSQAPLYSEVNDQVLTRIWSNVHEQPQNNGDHFTEPGIEQLKQETANGRGVEELKHQQTLLEENSTETQLSKDPTLSNQQANEQADPMKHSFSSLFNGTDSKKDVSPSVYLIPDDRPANITVFDISKLSESGKISKSPVFHLHDCPCKVQLSFWCTVKKQIKMCVTFWGISPQPLKVPKVLIISGMIKNWKSFEYTSLFHLNSPPINLQAQWSRSVELPLVLKTSRGHHPNITVETLSKRGYVCQVRDCISIDWTVISKNSTSTA